MELQDKVLETIQKYHLIDSKDIVVVGVSGGPDSMALLHLLLGLREKLGFSVCVSHINHGLRKEAEEETIFVQDYCKKQKIDCYVKRVDIAKKATDQKISTELAGRNARYDFFEEIEKKVGATKIATAHNANDNAETLLMNLLRGSGTSGLKGIEKMRDGKYIRPIIECTRKEIEAYCEKYHLEPRYDKSNNENIYTRNKIRNELIPYLEKEFNPNIVEGLNRLSTIVTKQEEYFHKIVENTFQNLQITGDNFKKSITLIPKSFNLEPKTIHESNGNQNCLEDRIIVLDLKEFNRLDEVIKSRIILYTISKLLGSSQGIEKIHIEDIIRIMWQ